LFEILYGVSAEVQYPGAQNDGRRIALRKQSMTGKKSMTDRASARTILFGLVRLWKNKAGQDLIEYALLAGFIAIAAGAIMPTVTTNISKIFSKVSSTMSAAAAIT
jgi:Flp pilus assembly pilin Flp